MVKALKGPGADPNDYEIAVLPRSGTLNTRPVNGDLILLIPKGEQGPAFQLLE